MLLGLTYRWNQNLVTSLNHWLDGLAILVQTTWANSDNAGLVQLLDGGLWEEDTAGGLGLGLDALDKDAVKERGERLDRPEGGGLEALLVDVLRGKCS